MKIGDNTNLLDTAPYEIKPGVKVILNAMPFGFKEDMDTVLPDPTPPLKPLYEDDGSPIFKDKKSRQQMTGPDYDDPEYQRKAQVHQYRTFAYYIYHATRLDKSVTWETDDSVLDEKFYDNIYQELKDIGLSAGRVLNLVNAIQILSRITQAQINKAKESVFLGEGA